MITITEYNLTKIKHISYCTTVLHW